MADIYAKVDGKWHTQPEGVTTGCGLPIPYGHEWTNKGIPEDDLCSKCFSRGEPKPIPVPEAPAPFDTIAPQHAGDPERAEFKESTEPKAEDAPAEVPKVAPKGATLKGKGK